MINSLTVMPVLIFAQRNSPDMTEDDNLRYEYEHLYNIRDQTILFEEICPGEHGFVRKVLDLTERLLEEITEKMEMV